MLKKSRASAAIIIHNNKILLFHRDNIPTIPDPDCWGLPGGVIEKGETPLQAVKRELSEEVTHVPQNLKYIGKKSFLNLHTSHIYMSYVDDNEARLFKHTRDEGQEIAFFDFNEIKKLKLARVLGKYFKKYGDQFAANAKSKTFPDPTNIGLT